MVRLAFRLGKRRIPPHLYTGNKVPQTKASMAYWRNRHERKAKFVAILQSAQYESILPHHP